MGPHQAIVELVIVELVVVAAACEDVVSAVAASVVFLAHQPAGDRQACSAHPHCGHPWQSRTGWAVGILLVIAVQLAVPGHQKCRDSKEELTLFKCKTDNGSLELKCTG